MIEIIDARGKDAYEFLNRKEEKRDEEYVSRIIEKVRYEGDLALKELSLRFDGFASENIRMSEAEIEDTLKEADPGLIEIMKRSEANIRNFHEKQIEKGYSLSKKGLVTGEIIRPLSRVGIYVPGGRASYPSSVLMNAVPAAVAGVETIAMATPVGKDGKINPDVLAAAVIAGVDEIYRMGGAQAIAAFAYGTESVPRVDKITGPGNSYVAEAKRQVYGKVDIDMIAGPSEVLIIADDWANPTYLAADMLSQAEHDPLATAIMITTSKEVASKTAYEIDKQLKTLKRQEIAKKSIEDNGKIIIIDSLLKAAEVSDSFAPEHLEIVTENPEAVLLKVRNAGSVFVGKFAPEPLGDYMAGTNHILPTSGSARFASPLSVRDFVKRIQYIECSREGLEELSDDIISFAEHEGLTAHGRSIEMRRK